MRLGRCWAEKQIFWSNQPDLMKFCANKFATVNCCWLHNSFLRGQGCVFTEIDDTLEVDAYVNININEITAPGNINICEIGNKAIVLILDSFNFSSLQQKQHSLWESSIQINTMLPH